MFQKIRELAIVKVNATIIEVEKAIRFLIFIYSYPSAPEMKI